jgi:hypothetical protein
MLHSHGHSPRVPANDAVETMLAVAACDLDEAEVSGWLAERIDQGAD